MNIDEVIKKQTEVLMDEVSLITLAKARHFVIETVNEVLKSKKGEALDRLDELIEKGKKKRS